MFEFPSELGISSFSPEVIVLSHFSPGGPLQGPPLGLPPGPLGARVSVDQEAKDSGYQRPGLDWLGLAGFGSAMVWLAFLRI